MERVSHPTLELLAWVHEHERTYSETIEAWRSHCPRLTVWEDALADDLVEVVRRPARRSTVVLTDRGLDVLS
jgi:predicted mannosyl-3-phosphoglycerate phosphatase (HAD superfamily)